MPPILAIVDVLETTPFLQETLHRSLAAIHTSKIDAPGRE
jgi:hypothetical protein